MRARGGLQGDGVHAGDFDAAAIAQRLDDAQRALGNLLGLIGMSVGDALDAGDDFVDARVVLHGAGAERIHAEIDGVIPGGEAREVADDFDLADLGHVAEVFALSACRAALRCQLRARRAAAASIGALAGRGLLEDQAFVLARCERVTLRVVCFISSPRCLISTLPASRGCLRAR